VHFEVVPERLVVTPPLAFTDQICCEPDVLAE